MKHCTYIPLSCDEEDEADDSDDDDDEFDDEDDEDDDDKADSSLDNTDGQYEKEEANNGIKHYPSRINVLSHLHTVCKCICSKI